MLLVVIPQCLNAESKTDAFSSAWIPACAGMTGKNVNQKHCPLRVGLLLVQSEMTLKGGVDFSSE